MSSKNCSKCFRVLPRDAFSKRSDRGIDSLRPACKECVNAARARSRDSATQEEKERALALARQWKLNNRERNRETKRAWEAANPEKFRAYTQRIQRKWRESNVELSRQLVLTSKQKKPDYYRQKMAEWAKREPHKARAKYKRYMTSKRGACPSWADKELIEEFYHLAQLRTKATGIVWHVDHVAPLQSPLVCGLHAETNLQVIPGAMNLSKSNRFWPGMPVDGAA